MALRLTPGRKNWEYQLAKDVLRLVYKVEEAFRHVRNTAIFGYEYSKDMANQITLPVQMR